jgi:hypothetical protein
MIPWKLHLAFQDGRRVRTAGGVGVTQRRRVADLLLPSGALSMGYPGDGLINDPSKAHPAVPPGRYPVFISFARHPSGFQTVAFVTVCFTADRVVRWEPAGSFFTDSGDGCVFDHSLADALRTKRRALGPEEWFRLKHLVYEGGDGSLVLDGESGANAIVFRTLDWQYDCFIGRGRSGAPACLVIDGRWYRRWDWLRFWQ